MCACARDGVASFATTSRNLRCSAARILISVFHAASLVSIGRPKKLLPGKTNEPRFSPVFPAVSLRLATYFQYAACRVSSQILWRPGAGRHAACRAVTPRMELRRFGPCQDFLSKASSKRSRSTVTSVRPPPRSRGQRVKTSGVFSTTLGSWKPSRMQCTSSSALESAARLLLARRSEWLLRVKAVTEPRP